MKIEQFNLESELNIQGFKKIVDAFLSITASKIFVQNVVPITISVLLEKSSKGVAKASLIKTETKMLLQT